MKRIISMIFACLVVFTQCTHPYEEDLLGAFPFAELLSKANYEISSDAKEIVLELSTNMLISAKCEYEQSASAGWVDVQISEAKGDFVQIVLDIEQNLRREERDVNVIISAGGSERVASVRIAQKKYEVSGTEKVHTGDLVLETQDQVNNCIYTRVEGKLIIGSESSNIRGLSALDQLTAATEGVKIIGCRDLIDLGPISNMTIPSLEFVGVNPDLVDSWKGSVNKLAISDIDSGNVDLTCYGTVKSLELIGNGCGFYGFAGLVNVEEAIMSDNLFTKTSGFESMTKLRTLDLSNNPLIDVNDLAEMTSLRTIDLSDTDLSITQIRYLKACLPVEAEIVSEGISGEVELELQSTDVKYYNAKFAASQSNMSKLVSWGYVLKKGVVFSTDGFISLSVDTNPLNFQVKNLSPDTEYSIWLCATDKDGAYHLSEMVEFTTEEIVYDYKGDLVLETQDDVDGCVHVTVSGNLLIGGEDSDIVDLSKLSLTSVGGSVIIKGCPLLTDFGKIATDEFVFKGYLELDNVSASLVSRWNGDVMDLRIHNISTGRVSLSKFASLTKLTLQDNNCEFTGFQYLDKVTDAVLSDNQFATVADIVQMTSLKNLDLRNNPLVNVNELADMSSLATLDLSGSRLSKTQVNYLRACLPSSVDIQSNNLKSSASVVIMDSSVKYTSATMCVEYEGISSVVEAGYILNTTGTFKRNGWVNVDNVSDGAASFKINNLSDNKMYHVWFYIKDSVGSIHLSDADTFKTKEIIENYKGDLVLSTQEEIDDCVHTSVTGNLIIGGTSNSDIYNLASLTIKSVTGSLTVRNCASLTSFGSLKTLSVQSVTLDNVTPSITSSWQGRTDELTIRNISKTSTCNITAFDEIKKLTLTSNKCSFSGWSSMKNLVDADLRGGNITTTEGFEGMVALKTLNLKGSKLNNINSLAQMPSLTSVDLSNTPLSETQVRYVRESLPESVTINATSITGVTNLNVVYESATYFTATLNASLSGVNPSSVGYYVSKDSTLPDESVLVSEADVSQSSFKFNATGLDDGTDYHLWFYVEDEYGSIHISAPTTFTTKELKHYNLSINPTWPSYTNNSSLVGNFQSLGSRMLVYKEEVLGEKDVVLKKSGAKFTGEMTEGKTAMGLFAVEGTAEDNTYDGYVLDVMKKDMDSPSWTLSLASENGSGSDVAIATLKNDFQTDKELDVKFVRPVAKLNITADFNGSFGSLGGLKDITITLEDHATKCSFNDVSSIGYSDSKDLKFSASLTDIPEDKIVTVTEDRYVFPHMSGQSVSVSVSITFNNGTVRTMYPDFNTRIEANKSYDLKFVTAITDSNGTFTVDVLDVVHDNIEF